MEHWSSEYFVERLKTGDFDYHLFEVLGKLTGEQLAEVTSALLDEQQWELRVN